MIKAEDVQYNTMKSRIESWRGVYADWQIIDSSTWLKMIEPFEPKQVKEVNGQRVISYGLSSFGYDMRVANEFKIFSASTGQLTVIDPKAIEEKALVDYVGGYCIIPPNSFALARSVEYFRMPANVTGIVLGKSTYARCGIVTNFTPLESGWEGFVTIEISNTTPVPVKVYANEGVAQCIFFGGEFPLVTYADRKGKYQAQTGITLAKV
jgi:dCTP deaminase